MAHEALLHNRQKDRSVRCTLCAHRCRIGTGGLGLCGVRENREGILTSLVYGLVIFAVERLELAGSACPHCGTPIEGIS